VSDAPPVSDRELTLDHVKRIAAQKGLTVLYNPDPPPGFVGLMYAVQERNECAGGRFWLARTLQEVLDGLQRELPRPQWRAAEEAAMGAWLEAEGLEAKRKAGVDGKSAAESRQWWQDVGQYLQRDWVARNSGLIARWRLLHQQVDDDQ
jgi:hypothetical protein